MAGLFCPGTPRGRGIYLLSWAVTEAQSRWEKDEWGSLSTLPLAYRLLVVPPHHTLHFLDPEPLLVSLTRPGAPPVPFLSFWALHLLWGLNVTAEEAELRLPF